MFHIVKISPAHGGHVFHPIKISSRNLREVHQMNIHAKFQWNPISGLGEEDFLKLHYVSYSENKPRPWRPCFSSDQNFFKESERTPPKEHSCKRTMKSNKWFQRRRFLKFFHFGCHGNQSSSWNTILWRNLKEDHLGNIPVKFGWNPTSSFRGEDL